MILRISCLPEVSGDPRILDVPLAGEDYHTKWEKGATPGGQLYNRWEEEVRRARNRMDSALEDLMLRDARVLLAVPGVESHKDDDVTCLYPKGHVEEGLGSELIVEVFGFKIAEDAPCGTGIHVAEAAMKLTLDLQQDHIPQCKFIKTFARPIGFPEMYLEWFNPNPLKID